MLLRMILDFNSYKSAGDSLFSEPNSSFIETDDDMYDILESTK